MSVNASEISSIIKEKIAHSGVDLDVSEVAMTRRLQRVGEDKFESKYLINNQPSRLRDLVALQP